MTHQSDFCIIHTGQC
uniref:Uncharacterized protein n=1 Tax=Arundo donax TaxID=35708 RepID=A0A0A8Z4P9_ARUDO